MLELHCHTTYSDGTLTPTQLVQAAMAAGVKALAITDHDTLAGWNEAIAAAREADLEIVPGVELSTVYRDRSLHILGFYPNPHLLQAPLAERLVSRQQRADAIVAKLADQGCFITLPEFGEGFAPARPHIAAALVKAGYCQSHREAFDRFLHDNGPAYVHDEKFSALDGIRLLLDCEAVPVWAHPYLFRGGSVEQTLPELVEAGLKGLEVYHPGHSASDIRRLESFCDRYGLLKTGGSDYHGPNPAGKAAESNALNCLHLPLSLLESLKQATRGNFAA